MDLYIVSDDCIDFEKPVKVLGFDKIDILGRKCLFIELEKSIDYSEYGILSPVSKFILVDRFSYNRLNDLNEFPIEVHVFIPKDETNPKIGFKKWSDLFNAAWANVYDNYEKALLNEG